jgi:hypothetical protein
MTVSKIRKDQPGPADLHVDQYLTNLSVGWAQDPSKFVASKVFPAVPVQKQSDKFVIWDKGFFFRDEVGPRPLGGRPPTAGKAKKDGQYFCEEEGLEDSIDDRTRANADQPLDPDRASGELLTEQMMIHMDRLWSDAYFKAGVWGTDFEGAASSPGEGEVLQFDQDGSEPIQTIRRNCTTVGRRTGRKPNKAVLGGDVFDVLCDHPDIVDRVKYTQRGVLTQELLAELFGVDEVLVPGGVENTANEGAADDIDFIVDSTSVLLAYAASAPAINTPTAGYTFAWTGLIPGVANAFGGVVERGRDELAHSDVLQIRAAFTPELVAPELGVFIEGAIG